MQAQVTRRLRLDWVRIRVSLRVFIALVSLAGVGLGQFVLRVREERAAVNAITRSGGVVKYDCEFVDGKEIPNGRSPEPVWIQGYLDRNDFHDVTWANIFQPAECDAGV
jgi:hypothetical protein